MGGSRRSPKYLGGDQQKRLRRGGFLGVPLRGVSGAHIRGIPSSNAPKVRNNHPPPSEAPQGGLTWRKWCRRYLGARDDETLARDDRDVLMSYARSP